MSTSGELLKGTDRATAIDGAADAAADALVGRRFKMMHGSDKGMASAEK